MLLPNASLHFGFRSFVQTSRVYEMCKRLMSGVSGIKQAVVCQGMFVTPYCIVFTGEVNTEVGTELTHSYVSC